MTIDIPEEYESLGSVLAEAVAQAARGKGADRHAEKGEAFSDQLIMSIPKRLGPGGECFCLGQALKKICESRRLPPDRARAELLGAIVYIAAAVPLLRDAESVSAPEDRSAASPLFCNGEQVEYAVQGKWDPAEYVGVDPQGKHVVCVGSSYIHLDRELIRKF